MNVSEPGSDVPPSGPSCQPPIHNTVIISACIVAVVSIIAVVVIVCFHEGDNTVLIAAVFSAGAGTIGALLGLLNSRNIQIVHSLLNGRMDALLMKTKEAAEAKAALVVEGKQKQEAAKAAAMKALGEISPPMPGT